MSSLLQQAGIGRLVYNLWHRPRGLIKESVQAGGPYNQWKTSQGQRAMEAAAYELSVPPKRPGAAVTLYVLTGRRFWFQTAFCLWTFAHQSRRNVEPVVLDDGTLLREHFGSIQRLFPNARLETGAEITARLDKHLPFASFPSLRSRRAEFPLLRKLTDLHVGKTGWKLFLDSDMLFFRPPVLLTSWLDNPQECIRATDVEYAYGYPPEMLAEIAGQPVDKLINTGILGLRSEDFAWDKMEYWCKTLIERAGTHYYQEQALVALHLVGKRAIAAPLDEYVTYPRGPEAFECSKTMHHYVASSKAAYFQRNWRIALKRNSLHL